MIYKSTRVISVAMLSLAAMLAGCSSAQSTNSTHASRAGTKWSVGSGDALGTPLFAPSVEGTASRGTETTTVADISR